MKLQPIITHTITLSIGSVLTAGYFLLNFVPATATYIPSNALLIKLNEEAVPIDYHPVLQKDFLGGLYLRNPFYFFKREKGYEMLTELAEEGYSSATVDLYTFEATKALKSEVKGDKEIAEQHYNKAYDWAKLAAENKSYFPLLDLVKNLNLEQRQDISEELKILAEGAESSSRGGIAFSLWEYYYFKKKDEKRAEYWLDIAQKISDEQRPDPACTTITPWKGW